MAVESMAPEVRRKTVGVPLIYAIVLVPVAAALNVAGGTLVQFLRLPIFLDIIGTVVVALTIGPWWAALTGLITNLALGFITNPVYIPFASINVLAGLIMGYGARWGFAKDHVRYLILTVVQAILTAAASAPIVIFVFGGATGHFTDIMTTVFASTGASLISSFFSAEIIATIADRLLSAFIALAIVEALPSNLSSGMELPKGSLSARAGWIVAGIAVGVVATIVFVLVFA